MLKIRLTRTGKRGQPNYRIVVKEARSKRDGKEVENLGFYNPLQEKNPARLNRPRYDYWLSKGALPSPTVSGLAAKLEIKKG